MKPFHTSGAHLMTDDKLLAMENQCPLRRTISRLLDIYSTKRMQDYSSSMQSVLIRRLLKKSHIKSRSWAVSSIKLDE
jgi:hypothetical protein